MLTLVMLTAAYLPSPHRPMALAMVASSSRSSVHLKDPNASGDAPVALHRVGNICEFDAGKQGHDKVPRSRDSFLMEITHSQSSLFRLLMFSLSLVFSSITLSQPLALDLLSFSLFPEGPARDH